jgi:hypothetical protein
MSKIPAFQFYPGDWLKDPALRSCSRAARGLWMDMLCLMHESPSRGYLAKLDGSAYSTAELIGMLGGDKVCAECQKRLQKASTKGTHQYAIKMQSSCSQCESVMQLTCELDAAGVLSKRRNGVIFSRRIVRDEEIRQARISGGSRSLEHPNVPQPKGENTPPKDILPLPLKDGTADPSSDAGEGYPQGGYSRPSPSSSSSLKTSSSSSTSKDKNLNTSCTEPLRSRSRSMPESGADVAGTLPLNDGSDYPITMTQIAEWVELYPAVDVVQECRNMKGWLKAHPTRRKTKRGIRAFINSWLAKEQDNAGGQSHAVNPPNSNGALKRWETLEERNDRILKQNLETELDNESSEGAG